MKALAWACFLAVFIALTSGQHRRLFTRFGQVNTYNQNQQNNQNQQYNQNQQQNNQNQQYNQNQQQYNQNQQQYNQNQQQYSQDQQNQNFNQNQQFDNQNNGGQDAQFGQDRQLGQGNQVVQGGIPCQGFELAMTYKSHSDCTKFYRCDLSRFMMQEFSCADGETFDAKYHTCRSSRDGEC